MDMTKFKKLSISKKRLYYLKNLFINNFEETDTITTFYHLNNYKRFLDGNFSKQFRKNKLFISKKFSLKLNNERLKPLQSQGIPLASEDNIKTQGFVNLSKHKLTTEQNDLLNNGPKFTIDNGKHKYEDINLKTDIEIICRTLLTEENIEIHPDKLTIEQKMSIKNFNHNVLTEVNKIELKKIYPSKYDKLIKQIKTTITSHNLITIAADKSNTLVLMEKSIYNEKMEIALNVNKFQLVTYNSIEKNERILQGLLRECLKRGAIDEYKYKNIYPSASPPVTIYGKIKLHKTSLDVRPIVNTHNSYVSGTSKWLVENLNKYVNRKHSLKNSYQLKDEFKFLKLEPGNFMISLDVESMFGSIDLQTTLDYIITKFKFDSNKPFKNMTLDLLNSLLDICTKDVCCNFNGKTYVQTNGCGMGLNLSPLLCEIQMWIVENRIMSTKGVGTGKGAYILAYKRFVDDLIFIISDQKYCDNLLNLANSILPNIKFTMEKEKDFKLNFLDITLIRSSTYLDFTVHRKETQNLLRINFFSNYKKHIIINNLTQEIIRAYRISSNEQLLMLELTMIKKIYLLNDYPEMIVNYYIETINANFSKYKYLNASTIPINEETPVDLKLTKKYIVTESNAGKTIQKHFKHLQLTRIWPNSQKIVLVQKGPNILGNILKNINTDKLDFSLRKFVVYFFQCYCGATYVGNTIRTIKVRANEHKMQMNSSINLHMKTTGHQINLNNFKILSINENTVSRFLQEKFFIEKLKTSLNREKGIFILTESF